MKLELQSITKRFGSFAANEDVDLVVEPGQIHCLLGENGAGKSTLMNVLYGLYRPSGGRILVDGAEVSFRGPGDAMAAGIGMVHQHFMLVPVFTVAENVALGAESTRGGTLDLETTRRRIREISQRYGFHVDPDAVVEDLPVGVQQRVEIIKALVREAQVLILDEPTAVLTPRETDELLEIMRQLRGSGKSILFISHKLREVKAISDVITVIRRGRVVGQTSPEASTSELAALMVGRDVSLTVAKGEAEPGERALEVSGLTVVADNGVKLLDDVGFDVARGEILAVAGVQGNGQTELAEAILGLRERATGSIRLGGTELLGKSVRQVLDAGVGFVPEDRSTDGLVGPFTVAENLVLDLYGDDRFSRGPSLRLGEVQANARRAVEQFDVRTPSVDAPVQTLSGGNQQKVVIARELSRPLELFLASQPTRGVDVGSIEFIHEQIVAERDKGVAVLIVSTELDEVYALADRIAVFFHGRIMGIVGPDTPRDVLGQMMAGATAEELGAAGVRPDGARRTGAQPAVPPQTGAPPTDAPQAGAPQATAQHPKEQA
ncbi:MULTISPECIES: ABC transporter ATP-binding protein [Kocuria]|jgi:simple sugar transport system ATP-binding protein|uniref:ABC transporter ATP-binding protein n=1 Tax=Kocuria TaxID=57493 RepID=UPI000BAB5E22|nr:MULTISPECIES: ABC transporter ATP-binding protein [Kocuria]MCM3484973.1 ABC transporter ATP-binding protein [Kocuria rosea]NVC24574.1 ABC transporter ATP-binding protein [Kocuria salina]PAU91590.1 heme ABC transporter ATP-binding protein [Kocuria sp. WN036]PWF89167.1 ABC transporter ATP-binding protein [Kocuria rosea]THE18567.1 ABC transporter ATP-binding protein [Kocuria rosea]